MHISNAPCRMRRQCSTPSGRDLGPEHNKADKYFGFKPGRGIHDIHFNQGNPPGRFADQNGPWQDGGLILEFQRERQGVGIFLKFQTQAWHSDDVNGSLIVPANGEFPNRPHVPVDRDRIPTFEVPDGLVRIIAAYVKDVRTPERESITLLNTADASIDLTGWQIKDKQKNAMSLSGSIAAGATQVIEVKNPVVLSNKDGIITLLNERGIKVHGVSYTKGQAGQPGRTIPFQA